MSVSHVVGDFLNVSAKCYVTGSESWLGIGESLQ